MVFYTVVPCINQITNINTVKFCETYNLHNSSNHESLENLILSFCIHSELPIDFYITVNNNYAFWGSAYFDGLIKSINGKYELFSLTSNPNHKGFFISQTDFWLLIEFFKYHQQTFIKEYHFLLEKIYDIVRCKISPDKPKRRESLFLFDNIKNCEKYIEKQMNKGVICIVDPLITIDLFKADKNLLDEIPFSYTYRQLISQVEKYWNGQISSNPEYEYLFQGSCKLIPLR